MVSLVCTSACAARTVPAEIVSLQALRADPSLTGTQSDAFELLAAADDLLVRARGEWNNHADERARRDAIMGQIKMKTALAILEGERLKARLAGLNAALVEAEQEGERVGQDLALLQEEIEMADHLASATTKIAAERKTLTQQLDTAKKQAASERQRLLDQLATEKRHVEALDALRAADLDRTAADTVLASEYAKAKYAAMVSMLQDAHKQFDAGKWDDTIARATTARAEAATAIEVARPLYERREQLELAGVRDLALEEAASAIAGITLRFERPSGLKKLVLVLPLLFADGQPSFVPAGAKILDAVKDLLTSFPTYPVQVLGYADGQGKPMDLGALALSRANAVFWALVSRGIDPRRMSVDSRQPVAPRADGTPSMAGRTPNVRVEIAVLYHVQRP